MEEEQGVHHTLTIPSSMAGGSTTLSPSEMPLIVDGFQLQEEDEIKRAETAVPGLQEMMQHMMQMTSAAGPLAKLTEVKPTKPVISIPGLSTIFGREAHLSRRIVWTVVVVAAITIATIQVYDRVQYYASTPVTVNVRVTMNDSLRFPVLTLCNKNMFNVSRIKQLKLAKAEEEDALLNLVNNDTGHARRFHKNCFNVTRLNSNCWNESDLVGYRGMDVKDVWDVVAHRPQKIISECWFGRNVSCNQVGYWSPVYTYMGVCYSFLLNDSFVHSTGMFNNLYVKLNESEDDWYHKESGWKVLIHDWRDSAVIDIRTHGSTLDAGWGKDVRLYLRQFQTLNTRRRPCIKGGNYSKCIERCFVKAAADIMTCRLPFMMDVLGLDYCSTPESYNVNVKTIENLLFHGHWSTNNCSHCRRQCDQDIYVAYTEMTQMKASDRRISKLRVFFQDFTFDEIEESADYGAVSLLCDIGGSLGFLLGFSVLTVFEIVDAIVQSCLRSVRHFAGKCRMNPHEI